MARSSVPALILALASAACARGRDDAMRDSPAVGGTTAAGNTAAGAPPAPSTPDSPVPARSAAGERGPSRPPREAATPPPAQPGAAGPSATPPSSASPAAQADTARGVVAVVGSLPVPQVVLRAAGGRDITLTGPLAREIGVASGADVWVRGRRVGDRTIEVTSYAVRTVDGVTAITGTLATDGDRLVLVTDDGRRHPIARPPTPLREHVGARVWISGDIAGRIEAYGVLRRAR
jgi:hypothetical protein